jgi:predicted hotdog family 3-hydroxylacyl-ACP dehydratase
MMENIPVDELIAHRAPMKLLDRLISASEVAAVAELTVRPDNPFYLAGLGLPAYVGIELMAQTISTIDGIIRRNVGAAPKIGFLLGCRRYTARDAYFRDGAKLSISVDRVFTDGTMFSFACRIDDDQEFSKGSMNVYAPPDPEAFLKRLSP